MSARGRDTLVRYMGEVPGTANGFNEAGSTAWAELGRAWAERHDLSDSERLAAGETLATRIARFRVRRSGVSADLTADDRLEIAGEAWAIRGVKDDPKRPRSMIEITAARLPQAGG